MAFSGAHPDGRAMIPPGRLPNRFMERMLRAPPGGAAGYLRGRVPTTPTNATPLLCVHGATFPGHATFDLRLDGESWLDAMAARGRPAFSVDLPGYGLAERPATMDGPPHTAAPVTRTEEATTAVDVALAAVRGETGCAQVDLFGWSWGTTLCAAMATRRPGAVRRLVLYGPQWLYEAPPLLAAGNTAVGAYRRVTMAAVRQRRYRGVPTEERDALVSEDWLRASEAALLASDPKADEVDPPAIRAPNGTLADSLATWCAGIVPYDAAAIRAPCLLVVGEWDRETPPTQARGLFEALTSAPIRRLLVLGRAGHWALLDSRRRELLHAVAAFLEEPEGDAQADGG